MAIIRIKRNGAVASPTLKAGELGLVGSDLHYGPWVNGDTAGSTVIVATKNGDNVFSANNTFNGGNLTLQVAANKEISFQNAAGTLTNKYFVGPDGFLRTDIVNASLTGTMLVNANYVDAKVQGLKIKTSVRAATIDNISLTTAITSFQTQTDGVTLGAGDRLLVRKQTTASENGIYVVKSDLTLQRAADFSNNDDIPSAFVFVQEGATLADTGWVCTNDRGSILGTSAINWSQFSGAGTYSAQAPIVKVGNEFRLGTVPVGKGGTGLTGYTKGDLLYASATNTLSGLTVGAAGTYLRAGSNGLPTWGSLDAASTAQLGGIMLADGALQTVAPNAVTAAASRTYAVQLNDGGQAVVNVPWENTDTNTTYTISTGDSNGEIKVTPSGGTAYNVAVKGLGSAAYTASTAYAAASHEHGSITSDGKIGTTADLMVKTTTGGKLTTLAAGTSSQFLNGTGSWATPPNTTYTIATGDNNGEIKVTPSGGTAYNVSVKGLGSAAYTASSAYAAASHSHGHITNDGKVNSSSGIASGDFILFADTSDNGLVKKSTSSFDGSTTTFLRGDGGFATPPNTASAADNILKGSNSGTQITYAPYTTDVSAHESPRFYTHASVPNSAAILKFNGQLQTKQLTTSFLRFWDSATPLNNQNGISVSGRTMTFETDSGAYNMTLSDKTVSDNDYSVLTVDYVEAIIDGGLW